MHGLANVKFITWWFEIKIVRLKSKITFAVSLINLLWNHKSNFAVQAELNKHIYISGSKLVVHIWQFWHRIDLNIGQFELRVDRARLTVRAGHGDDLYIWQFGHTVDLHVWQFGHRVYLYVLQFGHRVDLYILQFGHRVDLYIWQFGHRVDLLVYNWQFGHRLDLHVWQLGQSWLDTAGVHVCSLVGYCGLKCAVE